MEIRILQDGRYSDFDVPGRPRKVGAKRLAAGDVVDYPDWYAESIVASELAEVYAEPEASKVAQAVLSATGAASRLAAELNIDLFTITGTGAGGRITAGDVRKATQ